MTPDWDAEADDTLVCVAVCDETHDVRSFIFAAAEPRVFRYKPGQFMIFAFEVGGATVQRCYTLASTPTRPDRVAITSKRVPGGALTAWLHDTIRPGTRVRATGPLGDFTCVDHPSDRYLFLSGGSGITPLMSMARWHDDLASDADILFVHAARSPRDIIFRRELEALAMRPGFRAVPVVEADADERWPGYRGRLSLPMLRLIAPDLAERTVFCCGPAPFMAAVRAMLDEAGFDMARYHEESFDFALLGGATSAAATIASGFQIEFRASGVTIACGADGFILDAARAAGLRLPFACTKGVCGTCKSRLVSGTVDMKHGGGIRKREIDQGLVLICCSRPTSDIVLDR